MGYFATYRNHPACISRNFSAGTLRPRINRQLDKYLVKVNHRKPKYKSLDMEFDTIDISSIEAVISGLDIDKSVGPVRNFHGGTSQAKKKVEEILEIQAG